MGNSASNKRYSLAKMLQRKRSNDSHISVRKPDNLSSISSPTNSSEVHFPHRNITLDLINSSNDIRRIQIGHCVMKSYWNGNFSSPVRNLLELGSAKVLDVGCGSGMWCIDMATTYPLTTFVGLDVSPPPLPLDDDRLPNVGFLEYNILGGLPFPDETFHYCFQRFMSTTLSENDWLHHVHEIWRITKPGGWVEFMEIDQTYVNPGPTTQRLINALSIYLESKGISPSPNALIANILRLSPKFINVRYKKLEMPIGKWGGRRGEMLYRVFSKMLESMKPMLKLVMDIDDYEFKQLLRDYKNEMYDVSIKSSVVCYRVYAQKVSRSAEFERLN